MKEAFAGVLAGFQGLGSDDSRERPVDRLGAMGMAGRQVQRASDAMRTAALCSLGVDLIAFKFGNRASSKADSEDKLAATLTWSSWNLKLSARERDKVAQWAVQEWAIDLCPLCKGAKEIPFHGDREVEGTQRMRCCPPTPTGCGGTGKRRYSDAERVEALGDAYVKAMSVAHGIIGRAEALAVSHTKQLLERW